MIDGPCLIPQPQHHKIPLRERLQSYVQELESIDPLSITEIVAIDGPAGAGKSSVAKEVARRLNFAFLDSGAMYRATTWNAMQKGVDLANKESLIESTRNMKLEFGENNGELFVRVDNENIAALIRSPEVTENIKRLDAIPEVRQHLARLQRHFAARRPTVAEGRDMGTVVFPAARCKIYLDASPAERARRRAAQLARTGTAQTLEEIQKAIERRDQNDMTRAVSPLRQAADAIVLDTTGMSFDQVVDAIVEKARR